MNKNNIKYNPFEIGSLYKLISYDEEFDLEQPIDKDILMYAGITYNDWGDPCYEFYMLKYKMNTCIHFSLINKDPTKSSFRLEKI